MPARPIPEGFHSLTPYLIVKGAASALEFYAEAFGAVEDHRMVEPDGRIAHAQIKIGDSPLMLADECLDRDRPGPQSLGNTPVGLMLYVEDVDAVVARAIAAGATETFAVADQFHGDRMGGIKDPFGHVWYVATHIEDVSREELMRRAEAAGQPA